MHFGWEHQLAQPRGKQWQLLNTKNRATWRPRRAPQGGHTSSRSADVKRDRRPSVHRAIIHKRQDAEAT